MKERIVPILFVAAVLAASWAATCFIVWLITLCFGWGFSILTGTGVWLVLLLLGDTLKSN